MITNTIWKYYRATEDPQTKDRLIRSEIPRIRKILREYTDGLPVGLPCGMDPMDVWDYAILGLLEAMEHYDPEKESGFSAFSEKWILAAVRNGVWSFVGIKRSQRHLAGAYTVLHEKPGEQETLLDEIPDPCDPMLLAVERMDDRTVSDHLARELELLEPEKEKILREFYFEGKTLRQIARDLGCSHTWAIRLHKEALHDIQKNAGRNPWLKKEKMQRKTSVIQKSGLDF